MIPPPVRCRLLACTAVLVLFVTQAPAATNTLLDLNFNDTNSAYPAWGSTALTGSPGAEVSTLHPVTTNSGLFPTAPPNGYLALAPNASAVNASSFYGGWAANTTLATVNSPYTAGGFGQTNLGKISLTARVRATGVPAGGAVVILKLHAAGDNPNAVPSGYKRVMFEPVFLAGNDWTTVGGTLDNAALTNATAQGTRYNFPTNAANYQVLVELSGFNRLGTPGYVAYSNNPTIAAAGGRKNPGFDLSASNIRVEIDDVKLVVTDAATNGFLPSSSPAQLLRNGNFDLGDGNWSFFEGAYLSTDFWGENGNANVALIPGWAGLPYAGFMQNQIAFNATNGSFFTLTFRGKFEPNYSAEQTLVTFMNGNDTQNFKAVDITDQVAANGGQWATYTARYSASAADLAAMNGNMSVKIQPLGRRVGGGQASALIDDLVLSQQQPSAVGPQLTVRVGGKSYTDGQAAQLFAPLIGYSTPYPVVLRNDGAEPLTISSVALSGSSFTWGGGFSATLEPGESRSFTLTASPSSTASLAGTLTIQNNDKDVSDQQFVVDLQASPLQLSDDFTSGATPTDLGWAAFYDSDRFPFAGLVSSLSVTNNAMRLRLNSAQGYGEYPWYYGAKKVFASPGAIDLSRSSLTAALEATGVFPGLTNNKVQVYLESLNVGGTPTGRISLGQWVDETTAGSEPGLGAYFQPDGTNDRVAVLLPEGGGYTTVSSVLSAAINEGFNPNAPAFQIVFLMTDFDFDIDGIETVNVDSVGLNLVTKPFEITNGGFEADNADFAAASAPAGWQQFPPEGVSKNLVVNGDPVYNASLGAGDIGVPFAAYAGSKAVKIYGQNFYSQGVWQGPSQTGVIYQEWSLTGTASMVPGQVIHARAAAKVYSIDPLTGGSTFRFGFRYMDDASNQVAPDDVLTITGSNAPTNRWAALAANGTVPVGATRVQLIAEFVQNNATDAGAVYLDDVSVGLGAVPASVQVNGQTYQLAWSDEFNGASLNTANWTPETGAGGWGNNEAQTYTTNSGNLRVADGSLVIQAVKSAGNWTSARIKTQEKRSFKYGKIEFRAKLPSGVGPWPAAWMMGTNIAGVGWPNCGEVDVMEWRGFPTNEANSVGHALHSATRNGSFGGPVEPPTRSAVSNPSTQFHTYAVVWTSNNMTFSVDGLDTAVLTPPAADAAAFREEFFLLLNLAIGGNYLSNQIDPALTSATYEVDYVRVYQDLLDGNPPTDTVPPVITLQGANPVSVAWGSTYSDAGATAFDLGDNAASPVATNNPVDPSVPGTYYVNYLASDSKSNIATAARTVTVSMGNGGTNVGTDGLSDGARYAMGGTGPAPLSKNLLPTNSLVTGTNGRSLVITYHARTNNNVSLFPVASTDIGPTNAWTTNGITVQTLGTVATNGTVLERRQATTPADGSKKFLKLRATLAP